jgi:F-type H+-transporting ATPase subunit gamma
MESLEAVAKRIETTQSLRSVVRTMRALSAASIAQYEAAVRSMRQYMRTVEAGFGVVLREGSLEQREHPGGGRTMAVVFGSDHSLCGAFNERIAAAALGELRASERQDWLWLAVGSRAGQALETAGIPVQRAIGLPGTAGGLVDMAHRVLLTIDDWRARYGVGRVLLFHNRRRREAAAPHRLQLWPLDRERLEEMARRPWRSRSLPAFTMPAPELFAALVREHVFASIFRSGAESLASEHAMRLAAMQLALHNIDDRLSEMTADFRRKRQEKITTELVDVVAGFEMLRGR